MDTGTASAALTEKLWYNTLMVEATLLPDGQPRMQDVQSLRLVEVSRPAEQSPADEQTISVIATDSDSQNAVEAKVRQALQERHWWLNSVFQKKGIPREQITMQVNGSPVDVYNFGQPLSPEAKNRLLDTVDLFARSVRMKVVPDLIRYILIDDERPANDNTGEEGYGYSYSDWKAITLYPRAVEDGPYRIDGVQSLAAVIIHELSHNVELTIRNEWMQAFGWQFLEKPKELPGGSMQNEECDNPERCVNTYATMRSSEDFCESVAVALLNSERLDPERLRFIQEHILAPTSSSESKVAATEEKHGDAVRLPEIIGPVHFSRKPSAIKAIRRRSSGTVQHLLSE